ncbi:hypothetical protein JXO52_04370 [bacterium]|nr:hypothetical protein [bacterium]
MKHTPFIAAALAICLLLSVPGAAQDVPAARLPVLTTSAGQSNDVNTLNIILEQAGVKYDYCDVPTVDMIKAGVGLGGQESGEGFHVAIKTDLDKYPTGTPYKTIIFAIGASLKGMGASGLTIEHEAKRLARVINYCKENNIYIIAVHSGGAATRGAEGSDNERMIDAVAPYADHLVVIESSNKDGRFTAIAKEHSIKLTEVQYALNIVALMKTEFAQ